MPLPDLLRIWARVAGLPRASFVEAEWKERLGDDYAALGPFLRTEVELATGFPCPDPVHEDCPRRVVWHSADDIVAVCGNASPQCETVQLTKKDLVVYRLDTAALFAESAAAFRAANGLVSLTLNAPPGIVPIGTLKQRRLTVPVVWIPEALPGFETSVSALREGLPGDGLIAVLPPRSTRRDDRQIRDRCILLSLPHDERGDLALWRGLDFLVPGYRGDRARAADAIFDDVRIELAEEPGVRHVVRVNDSELKGFQKGDLAFLRLLVLAAARKRYADIDGGGWTEKSRLHGDKKGHALEELRDELRTSDAPGLTPEERWSLIKTSPRRDGRVRLAICPSSIRLDESLASFSSIGDRQGEASRASSRRTPGQKKRDEAFARQRDVVRALLREARQLGAPGRT